MFFDQTNPSKPMTHKEMNAFLRRCQEELNQLPHFAEISSSKPPQIVKSSFLTTIVSSIQNFF